MYKCTVCQKLYNGQTDYCDCGNDTFDEIFENPANAGISINMQQLISGAIFASCLCLSGWVWFGMNPEPQTVPSVAAKQETTNELTNIPPIDKIWDNTPINKRDTSPRGLYIIDLQKALYANLEETDIIDEGRCEIEFKVNSSGKLTNRRIYKEKGGSQFNNTVIKMMKRTSSVKTPPEGYEGSKFRAKVYTENGIIKISVR